MKKGILFFSFFLCLGMLSQAQEAPKDSTLKEFVGKYIFPNGSVIPDVVIGIENDGLIITSAAGTTTLVKQEGDLYTITAYNGTAKFTRDSNKKIIGVSIDARGYQLEGTKSEGINLTVIKKKEFVTSPMVVTVQFR
ncbi:MAG: hypothetical protein ABIS69_11445 [Sediminibacterium sp.]